MTGRKPVPANAEPGSVQDAVPASPHEIARQETSADFSAAQDSPPAQHFNPSQTIGHDSPTLEPSEHEIRLRAYQRYLDRGAFDGADFDDWLQAEMELKRR